MKSDLIVTTGIPALDGVLQGLRLGDNVVWQVEGVEDYRPLVTPFVARAVADGRRTVYFRFARHEPLVPEGARTVESAAELRDYAARTEVESSGSFGSLADKLRGALDSRRK